MKNVISVLMAVHAGEKPGNLDSALESVFTQTLRPEEVVLVEDGPLGAGLDEVVLKWKGRESGALKVIKTARNAGLARALNTGWKHCSGDLIARMDSDDVSLKGRFARQADFLRKNRDIDAVGGYSDERNGDLTRIIAVRKAPCRHEEIVSLMKHRNPMNHATVMLRKASLESVGGYPEEMIKMQDYALWAKMIMNGARFANIPEVLVIFRAGEGFVERRGGLEYFKYDIAIMRYLRESGFIGFTVFLMNLFVRFFSRISPLWIRSIIYCQIRRRP
jgi:glycosyltransferase involved in cell wall biosynthesis